MTDAASSPAASTTGADHAWELTRDAARFVVDAGDLLRADPLTSTVVATVAGREAARAAREPGSPVPAEVQWFAALRDGAGRVVGAAMRTAPFGARPAFVLPVPDEAARGLARLLHARGEFLGGVNGALPAAQVVAEETARLWRTEASVEEHTRLHELGTLVLPPAPPGRMRPARPGDAEDLALCTAWFRRFEADAAEQAGRPPAHDGSHVTEADVADRVAEGTLWLWETPDGTPVHLTGASAPVAGMSRIGPVLTPHEHRGRGYAGRAVAEVARLRSADGTRVGLFTDRANATSNALYARLGFRPVLDMANLVVRPPRGGGADGDG